MGSFKNRFVYFFQRYIFVDYGKHTMCGKGKKPNRLKIQKQSEKDNIIKNIRKLFELKKENEGIKDKIIRDINTLFEEEEEDFHTPVRISNFWNKTLMESESNDDKNKNLSVEEYLDKIKPYLKDIIIDLQKTDSWKIHLTIAIDFISSKFTDEEHVMYLKINDIEVMTHDNANEVVEEIFESLFCKYQIGLETSMKASDFIFDGVNLLYFKCHRIKRNVVFHILVLQIE